MEPGGGSRDAGGPGAERRGEATAQELASDVPALREKVLVNERKDADWYLGDHQRALFDTAGNAGPTIWVDGRIVGGWAIRATGEVVIKLLEDVGRDASLAVDAEAARLTEWLQAARAVPRFPSPLHKELVG